MTYALVHLIALLFAVITWYPVGTLVRNRHERS